MRTYLPGESEELLSEGWTLALTPADAYETPSDIPASLESLHVSVPGTVAQALEAAEKFDRLAPTPLNDRDAWYRLTMISDVRERATLRFDGLSTIAEIFFNGELIAASQSMFERLEVPVELTGADELAICFRALAPRLENRSPRPLAAANDEYAGAAADPHHCTGLYAWMVPGNTRRRPMATHQPDTAERNSLHAAIFAGRGRNGKG